MKKLKLIFLNVRFHHDMTFLFKEWIRKWIRKRKTVEPFQTESNIRTNNTDLFYLAGGILGVDSMSKPVRIGDHDSAGHLIGSDGLDFMGNSIFRNISITPILEYDSPITGRIAVNYNDFGIREIRRIVIPIGELNNTDYNRFVENLTINRSYAITDEEWLYYEANRFTNNRNIENLTRPEIVWKKIEQSKFRLDNVLINFAKFKLNNMLIFRYKNKWKIRVNKLKISKK